MPQSYNILHIVKESEWAGNDGPMKTYELALDGVDQTVTAFAPASEPRPEGQIEGFIDFNHEKGPRLKRGGGKGGSPKGRSPGGSPKGRSPAEKQSITKQHAQKESPHYYQQMREEGLLEKPSDAAGYWAVQERIWDKLVGYAKES